MTRYDAIVVGSGPAGLEAALNLKVRGKRFLLFGSANLSSKIELAERIDNYLGFPSIGGKELQSRFAAHLQAMEIELLAERVQMAYPMGDYFSVATARDTFEASTVILAPGVFSGKMLEGEERYLGRGVSYCATCDAALYRGKTVAVVGYNEEAVHEADYISGVAGKTYYVPMRKLGVRPSGKVEILEGRRATGVAGDTAVKSLLLEDGQVEADGVFILRDALAPAALAPGIELKDGFIRVDADMATNIPGCFAAGDCTGKPHQYMRAAGQGQTAALNAAAYMDLKNRAR